MFHLGSLYLNLGIDSDAVIELIDSAYVQARQLDATPADGIDSDAVIGLIDSDYISSRVTIPEAGTDSDAVIGIIDSDYVQARVTIPESGIDSDAVVGIIDSDYVQSRVTLDGVGIDSDVVISLIDSDYIQARETDYGINVIGDTLYIDKSLIPNGSQSLGDSLNPWTDIWAVNSSIYVGNVKISESDGELVITDRISGNQVIINGGTDSSVQLLVDSDYIQSRQITYNPLDSSQIEAKIEEFADSDYILSVIDGVIDSAYVQARQAGIDSGGTQFTFTRISIPGQPLVISQQVDDQFRIIPQGPLTVTTDPAQKNIEFLNTALDSIGVRALVDSDYVKLRITFPQQGPDSNSVITLINDTVDSNYIQARQADIFRDSNFIVGIIDSDYVLSRVTIPESGIDSDAVIGIIDSDYVSSRVTIPESGIDSDAVTGLIDSAYVSSRVTIPESGIDSNAVTGLIDSDYIQARQLDATPADGIDSDAVIGLIDSAYVQARQLDATPADGIDSDAVIELIDSAYISDRFPTGGSSTVIMPFAFARVATTSNGSGTGISWSNWNSGNATLDFTFSTAQPDTNYFVVTDAETFDNYYVGISNKSTTGFRAEFYDDTQSRTPSNFSPFGLIVYGSNPTQRIAGSVGNFIDSNAVIGIVDSDYVSSRVIIPESGIDSDAVTGLIDSAYISSRVTIPEAGTDSDAVIGIIDSDYVQARVTIPESGIDSDAVIGIIDSAYVSSRVTAGLDSDAVIGIIDSDYVQTRVATPSWDTITDKPALFNGTYDSLSNLPTLFNGTYDSLSNLPTLFNGTYDSLSNLPTLFNGTYDSLSGAPNVLDSNNVIAITTDTIDSAYINARADDLAAFIDYPSAGQTLGYITNTTFVNGALYPTQNGVFNLGAPTLRWRTLYIASTTIDLGGLLLSATGEPGFLSLAMANDSLQTPTLLPNLDQVEAAADSVTNIVLTNSAKLEALSNVIDDSPAGGQTLVYNYDLLQWDLANYIDSADIKSIFSGGTGVNYDSAIGQYSIGQPVATTDSVTFNKLTTTGDAIVLGNLTVQGTTTTINSSELSVNDKNIVLADSATNATDANGGGITLNGANATILYNSINDNWEFNKNITAPVLNGVYSGFDSDFTGKSTSDLEEGSRLYYTTARVDSAITIKADSAYVQLRQSYDYSSLINTPNILDSGDVIQLVTSNSVDSSEVLALIDSDYVGQRLKIDQSQPFASQLKEFIASDSLTIDGNGLYSGVVLKDGSVSILSSTGSPAYIDLYCEVSGLHKTRIQSDVHANYSGQVTLTAPTTSGTIAITSNITDTIDSNYIQARQITYDFLDSAEVIGLVDSAYVQARQSNVFTKLAESGGDIIVSANILPNTDSEWSLGSPDKKFKDIYLSGGTVYLGPLSISVDSDNGILVISENQGGTFVPVSNISTTEIGSSTSVTDLIDSAYIQERQAGATIDSDGSLAIIQTLVDSAYVIARIPEKPAIAKFTYTATQGQTTFRDSDEYDNVLEYTPNNVQVFYNGLLLVDGVDYTATSGDQVVFTNSLDSGDNVSMSAFSAAVGNVNNITNTYNTTVVDGLDSDAAIILINEIAIDSNNVIGLIDSAYVQLRQVAGTDSSAVIGIITGEIDSDYINERVDAQSSLDSTSDVILNSLVLRGTLEAQSKSFLIDHPTKENTMLRYGSLEGPENGVYVRGRITNESEIILPDYWIGLVDPETISVNLTPIGKYQELYVSFSSVEKITIQSSTEEIDAYYTVFAERNDIDKLLVEEIK
jgi:hypothetical protein